MRFSNDKLAILCNNKIPIPPESTLNGSNISTDSAVTSDLIGYDLSIAIRGPLQRNQTCKACIYHVLRQVRPGGAGIARTDCN
jgi:hypothetical protein